MAAVPEPGGSTDAEEPLSGMLRPLVVVGIVVAVMWAVELIDLIPGTRFDSRGIRPRELGGLVGIPLAPFLHNGFTHLIANTVPFLVLGTVIAAGSVKRFFTVAGIVTLISGLGVWLFAADLSIHIGTSGVVFGFLTYLISRGIFASKVSWIVGGVIVLLVYGGMLWGLLPRPGVSFTGHLFGAIGGLAAAWLLHAKLNDV